MSFYNTGNPVPSIDPRDLDDNAKILDDFVNGTEDTYVDRLGVERRTLFSIQHDADASLLRSDLANSTDPLLGSGLSGFRGRSVYDQLKAFPTPDQYGGDNTGIALSDIGFADAFAENQYVRLESGGIYKISVPIVLASNQTLDINGALLVATPGFTGNSMIRVTEPGATVPAWNANVIGKGKIDCAFNVNWAIEYVFARECDVTVQMLVRGLLGGVTAGTGGPSNSTGINCTGVSAWWHEEGVPVPSNPVNSPSSYGFKYINCSDSYFAQCFSVGYRKGFSGNFSIEYNQCHAWSRRVHGPLVTCFEALGDDGSFVTCYADAPHNWFWNGSAFAQDGSITEVIGFDHYGSTVNMFGCKCILPSDPTLGATNDLFIPVSFPVSGATNGTISGLTLSGATTLTRYKSVYRNYDNTVTVSGYRDRGADRLADQSHRGNHLPTAIPTTIEANAIAKTAFHIQAQGNGTVAELLLRRDNENRWIARLNSQTESGGNAGSNLDLVAYDDNGAFIRDHVRFSRSQARSLFFGRVDADQLFLNNFTLATLPSATTFPGGSGTLMMVSNPAAGKGRLVYSDGTIWRYVSDDSAA